MQLTAREYALTVTPYLAAYRRQPGSLNAAAQAACHYAKKHGTEMVVVQGNSYGHRVFHIAKPTDDLTKYTAMVGSRRVLVVNAEGKCEYAEAV